MVALISRHHRWDPAWFRRIFAAVWPNGAAPGVVRYFFYPWAARTLYKL